MANRQRFLERVRGDVKRAVADTIARRRVADVDTEEEVRVRVDGTEEPGFATTPEGEHDYVLPGTGTLNRGDRIRKPSGGASGGSGRRAGRGSGEDAFEFTLTREEFLSYFLEELELPRLARTRSRGEAIPPRNAPASRSTAIRARSTCGGRCATASRAASRCAGPIRRRSRSCRARIVAAIGAGDEPAAARARARAGRG